MHIPRCQHSTLLSHGIASSRPLQEHSRNRLCSTRSMVQSYACDSNSSQARELPLWSWGWQASAWTSAQRWQVFQVNGGREHLLWLDKKWEWLQEWGNGALRRHGCTCHVEPKRCPVKAARKIHDHGTNLNAAPDDPFLCTENIHEPPSKSSMVETFQMVARELGWDVAETKNMTGHALRATGAQYLARCGIEYYKIQLFCRWGSDTILRYLRDAPLDDSSSWISHSLERSSLQEVLCQTSLVVNQSRKENFFRAGYWKDCHSSFRCPVVWYFEVGGREEGGDLADGGVAENSEDCHGWSLGRWII